MCVCCVCSKSHAVMAYRSYMLRNWQSKNRRQKIYHHRSAEKTWSRVMWIVWARRCTNAGRGRVSGRGISTTTSASAGHFMKLLVLRENKWAPINLARWYFAGHIRFNVPCAAPNAAPRIHERRKRKKHFMCPVQFKSYVKQKLAAQRQQNILII